jgi:hypothetical protein
MDNNLQIILKETEHLFERVFESDGGELYTFTGILICSDDYYYVMKSLESGKVRNLSCVGGIEDFGFKLSNQK